MRRSLYPMNTAYYLLDVYEFNLNIWKLMKIGAQKAYLRAKGKA
jgi:hypothetical protein